MTTTTSSSNSNSNTNNNIKYNHNMHTNILGRDAEDDDNDNDNDDVNTNDRKEDSSTGRIMSRRMQQQQAPVPTAVGDLLTTGTTTGTGQDTNRKSPTTNGVGSGWWGPGTGPAATPASAAAARRGSTEQSMKKNAGAGAVAGEGDDTAAPDGNGSGSSTDNRNVSTSSHNHKPTTTSRATATPTAAATTTTTTSNATARNREDQLRQDCSFFYQGMDRESPGTTTTTGRSTMGMTAAPTFTMSAAAAATATATTTARDMLRRPFSLGLRHGGRYANTTITSAAIDDVNSDYHSYFEYQQHHNHRRVLSGRAGIEFMSKYERLNYVIDVVDDYDDDRPVDVDYQYINDDDDGADHDDDDDRPNSSSNRGRRQRRRRGRHGRHKLTGRGRPRRGLRQIGGDDNHDLFLDEDIGDPDGGTIDFTSDVEAAAAAAVAATTVLPTAKASSLLFHEQNGRVLMRVPKDQVRLLMDYDLEPGILAVEQRRPALPTTIKPTQQKDDITEHGHDTDTGDCEAPVHTHGPIDLLETHGGGQVPDDRDEVIKFSERQDDANDVMNGLYEDHHEHQLHYVLTVSDDLYRRVVSEMSYALVPPYWGFFQCCAHENEKADIKLALLIIAVVLFLMFIGSMEWPTE